MLSSSVTWFRSILRTSLIVVDFFLNCEYELLLLTFDEAAVRYVCGVVWAMALARSRL
jgi:hypothetical protein